MNRALFSGEAVETLAEDFSLGLRRWGEVGFPFFQLLSGIMMVNT